MSHSQIDSHLPQRADTLLGAAGATEERVCPKHGPYQAAGYRFGERVLGAECPHCRTAQQQATAAATAGRDAERRRERVAALREHAGLPLRFRERHFGNYQTPCPEAVKVARVACAFAERFEDHLGAGSGLVFCGRPGTGKTHLAAAITRVVTAGGRAVRYLTVAAALRAVKDTWGPSAGQTTHQVLKTLRAVDLLILDEVDLQYSSSADKLILLEIINGRYEDMRPTLLIANLTYEEMEGYLGERVLGRLTEGNGAVLAFGWDSYRRQVHLDPHLPLADVPPVDWTQRPSL